MANRAPQITIAEAKDALLRSGYLLEGRVADALLQRGCYVVENSVYADPDTGKTREYDVFGITAEKAGPGEADFIFAVFIVECVNNPQPIAFMTKPSAVHFLHHEEVKMSGLPTKIMESGKKSNLSDYLKMAKYHHYCSGRFSTQYCSFVKKKSHESEWLASHDENHFSSLKTLCDVVEDQITNHYSSWVFHKNLEETVNIQIYYPALVVQGQLLDVRVDSGPIELVPVEHIQFRRSIMRQGKEITFQIDVVTEKYLPVYLDMVFRKEIRKIARLLRRHHTEVRASIQKIVTNARRASKTKIREAMEA